MRGPQTEVFKAAACHSWSMVMLHTYDVPFPSCFLFYFYFYFWLFIYFLFLCADHPMAIFTIYINQRLTWAWYYSPVYSCPVCVQLILRWKHSILCSYVYLWPVKMRFKIIFKFVDVGRFWSPHLKR